MKKLAVIVACIGLITSPLANAKGSGGGRPSYSGGTHTGSHGGHYAGGSGSSHKGGTYRNAGSGDRYGTHGGK